MALSSLLYSLNSQKSVPRGSTTSDVFLNLLPMRVNQEFPSGMYIGADFKIILFSSILWNRLFFPILSLPVYKKYVVQGFHPAFIARMYLLSCCQLKLSEFNTKSTSLFTCFLTEILEHKYHFLRVLCYLFLSSSFIFTLCHLHLLLLTNSLHGAEFFLRSWLVLR